MLQACLNGACARSETARVPLTADELAADAKAVRAAGADTLHVHPRDRSGAESLAPGDVSAALDAIRAAVPEMPVGISTGDWIAPGGNSRHADMEAWSVLPDYVSVNLGESDVPEVMAMMAARKIGIEAGLASTADARRFAALARRPEPLRILIEMDDMEPDLALDEANAVNAVLVDAGITAPVLLHGFGQSAWACIEEAGRRGWQTRVGFEDVLVLPDGTPAPDNAALVAAARNIMTGGSRGA